MFHSQIHCNQSGLICCLQCVNLHPDSIHTHPISLSVQNPSLTCSFLFSSLAKTFSSGCAIEEQMDYRGNDIGQAKWVENQEACAKLSASNERALYWTFMPPTDHPWSNLCWIKTSNAGRMAMSTVVSGNRECGIECKCYNWMPWNVATLPRMTHLHLHLLQLYQSYSV